VATPDVVIGAWSGAARDGGIPHRERSSSVPNRAGAIGLGLVTERPNPRLPTAAPRNSRSPVIGAGIWEVQPVGDAAGPR